MHRNSHLIIVVDTLSMVSLLGGTRVMRREHHWLIVHIVVSLFSRNKLMLLRVAVLRRLLLCLVVLGCIVCNAYRVSSGLLKVLMISIRGGLRSYVPSVFLLILVI